MTTRLRLALVLMGCLATAGSARAGWSAGSPAAAQPVYQLRIYEIFEHNKAAFHARFRDHAMRIMRQYDFQIRAMWEARSGERTEFVYLLEWPSETVMKERWARFMADQEWARIKKESLALHGPVVGEIEERVLRTLDYSPALPPAPPGRR